MIRTIYHCSLRKLGILGDHGRKDIYNNHTNLITTVWKGTTGASATFVAKDNILTKVQLVILVAKSNQNVGWYVSMVTRGKKILGSSCKNGDQSSHSRQHKMIHPGLCISCQRLLDPGELLHKIYGHVIPDGWILCLGGSFECMSE